MLITVIAGQAPFHLGAFVVNNVSVWLPRLASSFAPGSFWQLLLWRHGVAQCLVRGTCGDISRESLVPSHDAQLTLPFVYPYLSPWLVLAEGIPVPQFAWMIYSIGFPEAEPSNFLEFDRLSTVSSNVFAIEDSVLPSK
ncbi:Uncharacterized protein PBTT_08699 [Plasmodiophora brassicae]